MLIFAGDPHGSLDYLDPFLEEMDDLAVIILGDLALDSVQGLEKIAKKADLWFIHGNHDSYTEQAFFTLWGSEFKQRNLHNRVVEIQGRKIAGLGGVFRGEVWFPPSKPHYFDPIHYCQYLNPDKIWNGGLPLKHRTTIFPSDLEILATQTADILITHEAPVPNKCGFNVINQLAETMQVSKIFHGHHHENFIYTNNVKDYRYQIISVGYQSVATEQGEFLLEGVDPRKTKD